MAQARYAMGGSAITPLQYDLNMKATVFYRDSDETESTTESTLHKRKGEPENRDDQSGDDDSAAPKVRPPKDPITWFGVLTPPTFKQSQKDWKAGTYLVASLLLILL